MSRAVSIALLLGIPTVAGLGINGVQRRPLTQKIAQLYRRRSDDRPVGPSICYGDWEGNDALVKIKGRTMITDMFEVYDEFKGVHLFPYDGCKFLGCSWDEETTTFEEKKDIVAALAADLDGPLEWHLDRYEDGVVFAHVANATAKLKMVEKKQKQKQKYTRATRAVAEVDGVQMQ